MKRIILFIVCATLLAGACNKDTNLQEKEATDLAKYLKDSNITVTPTSSGLYFIKRKTGIGPQAAVGKTVKVHYTCKSLKGKVYNTSVGGSPFTFKIGTVNLIAGFLEGILLMREGDTATLIMPSKLGYGDTQYVEIPAYSPLIFELELVDLQ